MESSVSSFELVNVSNPLSTWGIFVLGDIVRKSPFWNLIFLFMRDVGDFRQWAFRALRIYRSPSFARACVENRHRRPTSAQDRDAARRARTAQLRLDRMSEHGEREAPRVGRLSLADQLIGAKHPLLPTIASCARRNARPPSDPDRSARPHTASSGHAWRPRNRLEEASSEPLGAPRPHPGPDNGAVPRERSRAAGGAVVPRRSCVGHPWDG